MLPRNAVCGGQARIVIHSLASDSASVIMSLESVDWREFGYPFGAEGDHSEAPGLVVSP